MHLRSSVFFTGLLSVAFLATAMTAPAMATPVQSAKLTASVASGADFFGGWVGLGGSTAIVGSLYDDNQGGVHAGPAYLFVIPEPTSLTLLAPGCFAGVADPVTRCAAVCEWRTRPRLCAFCIGRSYNRG